MIALPPTLVAPAPSERPVTVEAARVGDTVRLRLIGRSARRITISFRLTCRGNGNSSIQAGSATLTPGTPATLLRLSQSAVSDWTGELSVTLADGTRYQQLVSLPVKP